MARMRGAGAVAAGVVAAAGCGGYVRGPDAARIDDHPWLCEAVVVENLTAWPIHTDAPPEVGEFLTLKEAEERGAARVRELGAEGSDAHAAEEGWFPCS